MVQATELGDVALHQVDLFVSESIINCGQGFSTSITTHSYQREFVHIHCLACKHLHRNVFAYKQLHRNQYRVPTLFTRACCL